MMAGADAYVASGTRILDRVFVPIDFSMSSHRALGIALELMRTHGSDVCLFHAAESSGADEWLGGIGSPAVGGDWRVEAEGRLRRFVKNVAPEAYDRVEVTARVGEPLRTLTRAAHEWRATLIIAPAEVHALLFRSPAERLVHAADIPVLVIPEAPNTASTDVSRGAVVSSVGSPR